MVDVLADALVDALLAALVGCTAERCRRKMLLKVPPEGHDSSHIPYTAPD